MNFKGTVEVFSCVIESNLAPGSGWAIYTNAEMLLQVVSPQHPGTSQAPPHTVLLHPLHRLLL